MATASAGAASVVPASAGPHVPFVHTLPGLQSPSVLQASFAPAERLHATDAASRRGRRVRR